MNAPLRQSERLGRLTTALGPDTLALLRFDGTDHLNDLFEYRVEALASRNDLNFDALIGTHATVEIETRADPQPFDGIVTSARWAGVGENGHRYDLTLRPWFWLASRRRNQRIFHNKTVVQILHELLADYAALGDPALEISLTKDYPALEYTVQYRESDLDFARRQMERAGISFHFRHELGSHTLVLTDDVLTHQTIGARPFKSYDGHHQAEGEHFWEWAPERNLTTGAIRLTDYDFKKPMQAMEVNRLGDAAHAQGQIESFDYPGDYLAQDVGQLVAGLRTEQERGADRRNRAVGDTVSLRAGKRVSLSGDPVPGTGETYLCLSAAHHFVSEAYGSGGQGSDGYSFTGSYVLMPHTAPMAPPRRTHVPVVQGPQTAVVVGEGEIDCDEYGRILVRFHWDLAGAHSMRCRVSQNWAGAGWGGMVIPRIGMEVLVEFLEGDPDKPVVTGCVYNGRNQPPYELSKYKTRSTFRTNSHDGKRTGHGFNELRFEDHQGEEEIRIIAQKDLNTVVLNNEAKVVMNDASEAVYSNRLDEVMGDMIASIAGSYTIYTGPGGPNTLSRKGIGALANTVSRMAYSLDRPMLRSQLTPGDLSIICDGSQNTLVRKSIQQHAGQDIDITAGGNFATRVEGNQSQQVNRSLNTYVGKYRTEQVGKKFVLFCGASRIEMDKEGNITITGARITIDGREAISLKSPRIDLNQGGLNE